MKPPTILIVDSERRLRRMLRRTLVTYGYAIVESRTGRKALKLTRTARPDLILLDINLPGTDGIATCRQLRRSCAAPIIVVTARSAQQDKVFALDAGADDYVVKPFEWEELLARIRALLRRYLPAETMMSFANGDIAIDFERRQFTAGGRAVHLRDKEFHLLKYLVAHKGRAVAHQELCHALWGQARGDARAKLRVLVGQLRRKIEMDPARPEFIQTEPSVGYRFQPSAEDPRLCGDTERTTDQTCETDITAIVKEPYI